MASLNMSVTEAKTALKGKKLGSTEWKAVTQEQVNDFAKATGDHQWIHTDPVRAAKESPFKGPIAHGYLSLSLVPTLLVGDLVHLSGAKLVINYGANKIRFPTPVPVGGKVRLTAEATDVEEVEGGIQVTYKATLELEGAPKPALAAELLYRYYV